MVGVASCLHLLTLWGISKATCSEAPPMSREPTVLMVCGVVLPLAEVEVTLLGALLGGCW